MTQAPNTRFRPLSSLTPREINDVRSRLTDHPLYRLYFEAGLADLAQDTDNRLIWLGPDGLGQGVAFDGLTVFSTLGQCPSSVLAAMLDRPGAVEIHATSEEATELHRLSGAQLRSDRCLLVFGAKPQEISGARLPNPEVRQMTDTDHPSILALIQESGHRDSVYSRWMLEQPFLGCFEHGRLVATAGTIILDSDLGMANIGCFLTRREHRGKGLAGALANALVRDLSERGIRDITLVTTEDNKAACRVYERVGFSIQERRRELLFDPIG